MAQGTKSGTKTRRNKNLLQEGLHEDKDIEKMEIIIPQIGVLPKGEYFA